MSDQAIKRASERGENRNVVRTFEDLIAWQKAMRLAEEIYKLTRSLPEKERFGLCSQMRRAAVSVPSNIAEGHGRGSRQDYIRFLRTARGSINELRTQLMLASRLELVSGNPAIDDLAREVAVILQALIRSLEKKKG